MEIEIGIQAIQQPQKRKLGRCIVSMEGGKHTFRHWKVQKYFCRSNFGRNCSSLCDKALKGGRRLKSAVSKTKKGKIETIFELPRSLKAILSATAKNSQMRNVKRKHTNAVTHYRFPNCFVTFFYFETQQSRRCIVSKPRRRLV